MSKSVLVTGAAGFIGFHLARRLLTQGWIVFGLDNLNDYYDVRLKEARLARLTENSNFSFSRCELADRDAANEIFARAHFDAVVHLAAQAGVAHSATDPASYVNSNLVGFANVLEGCRHTKCRRLLYASSSSVYGANRTMPLRVTDRVDEPLSLYGATKRANELMAYAYAHAYGLPSTGLRFFTVYGPWGRPDMAVWLFTKAIFEGKPLRLFNSGRMRRDFTYIDDVIESLLRLIELPSDGWPTEPGDQSSSMTSAPHRIFNVGNSKPVDIGRLVDMLESIIGKHAKRELLPMRPVDVLETLADSSDLERAVGFKPDTLIEVGLRRFVEWYRDHEKSAFPASIVPQ